MDASIPETPRLALFVFVLILVVSSAIRLFLYFSDHELRHDEISVALNLGSRDLPNLLKPLDYGQAAPPLFLWMEKTAVTIGGMNSVALRFFPLLAGLALPYLVWRLARSFAPALPSWIAATMVAISPLCIRYSFETKPYIFDSLMSVLIALIASKSGTKQSLSERLCLLITGLIAITLSVGAPFVLFATVLFILLRCRTLTRWLAIVLVMWGALSVIIISYCYAPVGNSKYMKAYWKDSYLASPMPTAEKVGMAVRATLDFSFPVGASRRPFASYSAMAYLALIAALVLAGAFRLAVRGPRSILSLMLVPLACGAFASALGTYPFAARTLLFSVPFLAILVAIGISSLCERPSKFMGVRPGTIAATTGIIVLLLPHVRAWTRGQFSSVDPGVQINQRSFVQEVYSRITPSEPAYIFGYGSPTWLYYTTNWNAPNQSMLRRMAQLASAPESSVARLEDPSSENRWICAEGRPQFIGAMPRLQQRRGLADVDGWIDRELSYIHDAAVPRLWVVFLKLGSEFASTIEVAIRDGGGRKLAEVAANHETRAVLYTFPKLGRCPCGAPQS